MRYSGYPVYPINLLLVVGLSSFILMEAYWKAEEEEEYCSMNGMLYWYIYMNNLDRNVNWATFSALARRRSRIAVAGDYFNDLPAHGHGR